MASATAQQTSTKEGQARRRHRHSRHSSWVTRIRPATWRKIAVYVLVYAIATIVIWKL